jgi:hypothetical protein
VAVQRCGPVPCDCPPEEKAKAEAEMVEEAPAAVQRVPDPVPVQRVPLTSPCFASDADLQDCRDDRARLTMNGLGQPGTRKVESGAAVQKIQQVLLDLGLSSAPASGTYDRATWNAVKALKARERLGWESMGDVGPGTMAWLDANSCRCPRTGPAPACCPACSSPTPVPPVPPTPVCPDCSAPGPRPAGCPPCPTTDHIQDCDSTDTATVAAARAAALTELAATISTASVRPLTPTVRQAMWRAFRIDSVSDTDSVVARLRAIQSGLPSLTIECEGADFLFCPDGVLGYTRPISHLLGTGNIHVCTPGWRGLSAAQQAETVIHEGSHRFNGTNDDGGYFSLEGDESGATAGQLPGVRLNNADSYTAFCIYLTRKPPAEVEDLGEGYRGNQLAVEQDPTGPIALPGTPDSPRLRIRGNPPNSGFTFRWVIADRQDRRYLMRADSGNPFQFGPHVEVRIGAPTRALLQSRGIADATVLMRALIPAAGDRLISVPVTFQLSAPTP